MENLVRYDGEKGQYQFKVEVQITKKQQNTESQMWKENYFFVPILIWKFALFVLTIWLAVILSKFSTDSYRFMYHIQIVLIEKKLMSK